MNGIMVAAVIAGSLVILGYLLVIWWLDRYEREPLWMLLLVFAWGALGGTSFGCLCSLPFALGAVAVVGESGGQAFTAVVVAPVVEELTKGVVLAALLLTKHLDNETDGLIYGAATGLGFAIVENVVYAAGASAMGTGAVIMVVVLRTFLSALVHCISSGILGMTIGYACHRSGAARWLIWPGLGLALAIANHAIWNGLATAAEFEVIGEASPALLLLGVGVVIAASATMFGLTQLSLHREHAVIRRHLLAESSLGVLPPEHASIIPFWSRRRRTGWLEPHVPQEPYVRAATLLAFRHHQLEVARGERRERYLQDIAALRAEVTRHLRGA
ncbi:MAG: PrsW family intramembrane metalloprotease [Phycisphaerales bacterium]|nr:PrsW family intramembrane metalloprotease [Phycisphaerales bacterium]